MTTKSHQRKLACLTVLFAVLFGAGCSMTTVSGSWMNENYAGTKLNNVLVLASGKDEMARRIYEHDMVKLLKDRGVNAHSVYAEFPHKDPIEKDRIKKMATEKGFDTILVTKVTSKKRESETRTYTTGNVYYSPRYYSPYRSYPYYNNWYGHYDSWGATSSTYTYEYLLLNLETNLYDLHKEELIWSTVLESVHDSKVNKTIQDINKATIKQMSADGLI